MQTRSSSYEPRGIREHKRVKAKNKMSSSQEVEARDMSQSRDACARSSPLFVLVRLDAAVSVTFAKAEGPNRVLMGFYQIKIIKK